MAMEKETWNDISVEEFREYIYDNGFILRVNRPSLIMVSESSMGGHAHRIQTEEGTAFYIPPGWTAISWRVKSGNPLFKY